MLLDLPGPALRLLTDVADFHFSDIAVRGDDGARAVGATDDDASPVRGGATYGVSFATSRSQQLAEGRTGIAKKNWRRRPHYRSAAAPPSRLTQVGLII
jgi:hypothetical protein